MALEVLTVATGVAAAAKPTTEAVKAVADPYFKRFGYLFHYKKYYKDLDTKVQHLLRVRNDTERAIDLDTAKGHDIHEVVSKWISDVRVVEDRMKVLKADCEKIKTCLPGWCSARYRLGKESKKKIPIVDDLITDGKGFNVVSIPTNVLPSMPLTIRFKDFASRTATKNAIVDALKDDTLVGVYGIGGVGKTTLVKQIWEEVIQRKIFEKVVFVTISTNPECKEIQTQIGENLGLAYKRQTESVRAAELMARLKREKNILIILDDLWEELDLDKVGINLSGAGVYICKVLFTSRDLSVCKSMKCIHNIQVKILPNNESLELFEKEVGNVSSDARLVEVSKNIVAKCGGLPLAIVTIAGNLKGNDDDCELWDATISGLKNSNYKDMNEVIDSIKKSYDRITDEDRKSCFKLCALFPQGHKISFDILIGYALGEGLLGKVGEWETLKYSMVLIVKELVSLGLLLDDNNEGYKKISTQGHLAMHTIFRDAAISMARKDSIMNAGIDSNEWPKQTAGSLRISLMSTNVSIVPDAPKCSELITLSLASNKMLNVIPSPFFNEMGKLGTLDLSETGISIIPQSLSSLGNCLISLYLDGCKITPQAINVLGQLETLEVLSLRGTGISQLPAGVLPNLKKKNFN